MAIKLGPNGLPIGQGFYWNGNIIYLTIWHNGKKYGPWTTHTNDWQEAVKFRSAEAAKIERREVVDLKKGKSTVADLFAAYIVRLERKEEEAGAYMGRKYETPSYKASTRINRNIVPHFGNLEPNEGEVTNDVLVAYSSKRKRQGASVSTINTEFRLLRAALRRGVKEKKVNPLRLPDFSDVINEKAEKNAARTGTISEEQFDTLMQHASEHLKPVLMAVIYSGVRAKEIKFVRREQVNFEEGMIELRAGETKAGDARVVPMNERVKEVLLAWEERTKELHPKIDWFFHCDGHQLGNWKTAWNATLRRAGLRVQVMNPDGSPTTKKIKSGKIVKVWKNLVKFHDTRRTNVTAMDDIGIAERDNMSVSGHKTVGQNRKYNQSKKAAQRVRDAQNTKLGLGVALAAPVASAASVRDWKAELRELKEAFDAGLLPEESYKVEIAKVMANR